MEILKGINATLAFALELVMFGAFGWWGYSLSRNGILRWSLACLVPLAVIAVWGVFAAPSASHMLAQPGLYFLEVGISLGAALLLYRLGRTSWAIWFAGLVLVSQTLALLLKQ